MTQTENWEIPDSDVPDELADEVLDEVSRELGITPIEINIDALRKFEAKHGPKPVSRTPRHRVG